MNLALVIIVDLEHPAHDLPLIIKDLLPAHGRYILGQARWL